MAKMRAMALTLGILVVLSFPGATSAQQKRWIEGIWSDPPTSIIGELCAGVCSDVAVAALNQLLDDPRNDPRPFADLLAEAQAQQRAYITERLLPRYAAAFPPDPADDPSFVNCEPYAGPRQMFARHQLQVTARNRNQLELRYGEWDQRRTVYMDARARPNGYVPTRLGFSVGRWEGETLVIETSGFSGHWGPFGGIPYTDRLHILERYTRGEDGRTLWLTATLTDPGAFREPIILKRLWRWAPGSEIAPVKDCEKPTSFRRREQMK